MSGEHRDAWRNAGETFRPRNLLQPCLLILLEEEAGYGYELNQRLERFGSVRWDMPAVYRALNGLEDDGLITSHWERSEAGPGRRCYATTSAGREVMAGWARELADTSVILETVLRRYQGIAPEPAAR
jgi:PadR family transcriptional regulator